MTVYLLIQNAEHLYLLCINAFVISLKAPQFCVYYQTQRIYSKIKVKYKMWINIARSFYVEITHLYLS